MYSAALNSIAIFSEGILRPDVIALFQGSRFKGSSTVNGTATMKLRALCNVKFEHFRVEKGNFSKRAPCVVCFIVML